MAYELPRFDQFLPRLTLPPAALPAPEPMGPPEATYDDLTPAQKAWVDKQRELQRNPRGALGEIAAGAWRGAVGTLPQMVGQALQATGRPGDAVHDIGTKIVDSAKLRGANVAADENPDAHGSVVNAFAQGAEMIAPSLSALAVLPVAAGLGLPAAGAAAATGAAAGTLFGASTFQDTYERGIKAGLSEADAKAAAVKSGLIEGAGEAIATPVLGGFLGTIKRGIPRVLGRKYAADEALSAVRNPKFLKEFAKDFTRTAVVETATEMGQNAGEAAVERAAGISDVSPWDAATEAIGPTLAMTALLGPFGALGMRSRLNRNQKLINAIESPTTNFEQTHTALRELAPQLEPLMGKVEVNQWRSDVLLRANAIQADMDRPAQIERAQQMAQYQEAEEAAVGPQLPPPMGPFPNTPTAPAGGLTLAPQSPVAPVAPAAPVAAPVVAPQSLLPTPVLSAMRAAVLKDQQVDTTRLKGWLTKNDAVLNAAATEQTWEAQLEYLRKARDSMAPKKGQKASTRFEMMDALVKKVEGYHGIQTQSVPEEVGQGAAQAEGQPVREARGEQEGGNQGTQGQDALLKKETTDAVPVASATEVLQREQKPTSEAGGKRGRVEPVVQGTQAAAEGQPQGATQAAQPEVVPTSNAAPATEAVSTPPPVPAEVVGAAPVKETKQEKTKKAKAAKAAPTGTVSVVSSTGEVSQVSAPNPDGTVPWGQGPSTPPLGDVSYDTPGFGSRKVTLQEKFTEAKKEKAKERLLALRTSDVVPEEMKRKINKVEYHFAFENYNYDSNAPRHAKTNLQWITEYEDAVETAKQVTPGGQPTVAARNAQNALAWLNEYEGADIAQRAVARSLEGWAKVNDRFRPIIKQRLERIAEAEKTVFERYAAEDRYNLAVGTRELGRNVRDEVPPTALLARDAEAALKAAADNDPELQNLLAAHDNYVEKEAFREVAKTGDLDATLASIQKNATSDWVEYVARWLRDLNLSAKLLVSDEDMKTPREDKPGSFRRTYGRYSHRENLIKIFNKGASAHTILHETAHAATIGEINRGIAAMSKPAAQLTAEDKSAMESVKEVRALMKDLEERGPTEKYGFKNEAEFVAEVLSNEKLQAWMNTHEYFGGLSWWQKFLNVVSNFFGFNLFDGVNALDHTLSVVSPLVTGSRFGEQGGATFNHTMTAAAAQVDATGSALVQKATGFVRRNASTSGLVKQALHFTTTFNLAKLVERVPYLAKMSEGLTALSDTDHLRVMMRMEKQRESTIVTKPVLLALEQAGKDRAKRNAQMQTFAGVMSQLGIDLNKNYEQNKKEHPELDPKLRDYVNQMHAEYRQFPEQFRKPLEESFRVLRKGYIQQSMTTLRDVLRSYAKDTPGVRPYINQLDIRNLALSDKMDNPKPEFYLDSYSARADAQMRKVLAELIAMQGATKDSLTADLHDIDKFYNAAVNNPYMHLGRSGEYFLEFNAKPDLEAWDAVRTAFTPLGKVIGPPSKNGHVFMRFETAEQRNEARKVLDGIKQHLDPDPTKIKNGSLLDAGSLQSMQGIPVFARRLMRQIDEDFAGDDKARTEMRAYIKRAVLDYLPDSAPQKALGKRSGFGVAGYDADFLRSFTKRTEGQASMLSNSYTMPMYDAAFKSMQEDADAMRSGDAGQHDQAVRVLTEMGRRFGNSMTPVDSPVIDGFKAFGFNYFLALSPAFWLTNMVQPYHLTLPFIGGRYGFVATAKEMGRSTKKGFQLIKAAVAAGWTQGSELGGLKGGVKGILDLDLPLSQTGLTDKEMAFVQRLILSGQLDTTQGHEQGRLASGDSERLTSTMKLLSMGSHYTEVLNRLTAGITAYNMAMRNKPKHMSDALAVEHAVQYGIDAVRETQFDYSDHNTARALGRHGVLGKVTPLVASFQQYVFQTMELLIRMSIDAAMPMPPNATEAQIAYVKGERKAARRGLAGVLGVTSFLAGSLGLPMANAIAAVVDRVIGDDDDPTDVKSAYRAWLADIFGTDVAEAVARGVPRAVLGFDTATRMGMQDILPGTRFLADRRAIKDKIESGAFNLLGPAVSAGTSAVTGLGKMLDGKVMEGLIEFAPLALKGPIKAAKAADEGYTTSTGNQLPLEVTPWGTIAQSLGFTPSAKAEQSEVNFAFRQRDMLLKQRKTILANKIYNALEEGEDATALLQEVMLFNQTNPQYRIDVAAGMASRAKARATAAYSDADIATLPRYLPLLDRYSYANTK